MMLEGLAISQKRSTKIMSKWLKALKNLLFETNCES